MEEQRPTVFDAGAALELQSYLGQRLQESKTQETSEEIERAMDALCADVLVYLGQWVRMGKRSAFGEGCVLYWVDKYWSALTPLHAQYDSFHDFANQETQEDYATYRAKIGVYKTFVLNENRDATIAEHGPDAFLDIPLGKLQKAIGTIHRGAMSPNQWDALMDSNVRDREFHHLMKALPGESTPSAGGDFVDNGSGPEVTVSMEDGSLRYWPGGRQIGIKVGSLDVTSKDDGVRGVVDEIIVAAEIRRV
ncbi:MAG: hypothetical protein ABID84_04115 [Chloroflexota bacterium]